jgi:tRNA pseudouridine synthase 10
MLDNLEALSKVIAARSEEFEFSNFQVGAKIPPYLLDREDEIRADLKIKGRESLKSQITRNLNLLVSGRTGKPVEFKRPDLTVLVNLPEGVVEFQPRPIWVKARYLKHTRGISQRESLCPTCNGVGCAVCSFTGRKSKSVQALVRELLMRLFNAENVNFIWMGSEDENSLVLGEGRPFYAELLKPRRRSPPLQEVLGDDSTPVTVRDLEVLRSRPRTVPHFKINCTVHLVKLPNSTSEPQVLAKEEIEGKFRNCSVQVRLSRKFRVVSRTIDALKLTNSNNDRLDLEIECDGGIPIKKFVLGDSDNSQASVWPNLSEYLKGFAIDPEKPFDIMRVTLQQPEATNAVRGSQKRGRDRSKKKRRDFRTGDSLKTFEERKAIESEPLENFATEEEEEEEEEEGQESLLLSS